MSTDDNMNTEEKNEQNETTTSSLHANTEGKKDSSISPARNQSKEQLVAKIISVQSTLNVIQRILSNPNETRHKIINCKDLPDQFCISSLCKYGFKQITTTNEQTLIFDDKNCHLLQIAKDEMQNLRDQLNTQLYFPIFTSNVQNKNAIFQCEPHLRPQQFKIIDIYNEIVTCTRIHRYTSLILNLWLLNQYHHSKNVIESSLMKNKKLRYKKIANLYNNKFVTWCNLCNLCDGLSPIFGNGCDGCNGQGTIDQNQMNDHEQKIEQVDTGKHILNALRKAYKTSHDINRFRKYQSNFMTNHKFQQSQLNKNNENKSNEQKLESVFHGKGFVNCLKQCFAENELDNYLQSILCIDISKVKPIHGLNCLIGYFLINSIPAMSSCIKLWNNESVKHGIDITKCIWSEVIKYTDSWIQVNICEIQGWNCLGWSGSPILIPVGIMKKIQQNPNFNIHLKTETKLNKYHSINKNMVDLFSLLHNLAIYYPNNDQHSVKLLLSVFQYYPFLYLFILKGFDVLKLKGKELINRMKKQRIVLKEIEESQKILNAVFNNVGYLIPLIKEIVADKDAFDFISGGYIIPVLPLDRVDNNASTAIEQHVNEVMNQEIKDDPYTIVEDRSYIPRVTNFQRYNQLDIRIVDKEHGETIWVSGTICKVQADKILIHVPRHGPQWKKKISNDIAPPGTYTDKINH